MEQLLLNPDIPPSKSNIQEVQKKMQRIKRSIVVSMICCVALLVLFASDTTPAYSESITIAPFKINLRAVGKSEDIQAVIRMPLASGYQLTDYEVNFKIGTEIIAQAIGFRYCYIDDNFLASFDRMEIQNNPTIRSLANSTVVATVDGWYTATNAEGNVITVTFSGNDTIEIIKPGK